MNIPRLHPHHERAGALGRAVAAVVAYYLAQQLAFLFPGAAGLVMAIWPAAGIALAALLLSPRREWPALLGFLFAAGLSANLTTDRPFPVSFGFMVANISETASAAWLITWWCGTEIRFSRTREIVALIVVAVVANGATAVIAAGTSCLITGLPFGALYETWWVADGLGLLLVTPVVVAWATCSRRLPEPQWSRIGEALLLFGAGVLVVWRIFGHAPGSLLYSPYMAFVFVVWAAMRFGPLGTVTLLAIIAPIAIGGSLAAVGPYALGGSSVTDRLLTVQLFIGILTAVGLTMAASLMEQKESLRLLGISEKRLRSLGDNLPNGFVYQVLREPTGAMRFTYVSAGVERLNGISAEAVLRDSQVLYGQFHPEDRGIAQAAEMASLANMTVFDVVVRMRRADGQRRWMRLCSCPRRLDGERVVWDGMQIDITDQRTTENALAQSRVFLDSILEHSPNALWISDEFGTMLRMNQACRDNLRLRDDEVVGKYNLLRDNQIEAQGFLPLVQDVFEKGRIARFVTSYDTGAARGLALAQTTRVTLDVSISPILDPQGKVTNAIVQHLDITARMRAEAALKTSDELHRALIENLINGYAYCQMHFDLKGRPWDFTYLSVNGAFESQTGLRDVVGKKVSEVIPGFRESEPELLGIYGTVAQSGRSQSTEIFVVALKTWFWLSVCSPGRGYFMVVFDVITERKRLEAALRQSERDLIEAQALAHIGSWLLEFGPDGERWSGSVELRRIYGYPPDFPMDMQSGFERMHPDDRDRITETWTAFLGGTGAGEWRHRIVVEGRVRWMQVSAKTHRDDSGRLLKVTGTNQDITEQQRAEEALCESEERFRSVVTVMAEGFLRQDGDGSIVDCNQQAEEILGLSREQILGRTSLDPRWNAIREDGSPFPGSEHPAVESLRTGQRQSNVVMGLNLPNGELRWININVEPIFRPGETRPRSVVCTFSDITQRILEQKKLQKLLEQAAVDAWTKGNLLREVNHRVTNNLSSILGLLAYEESFARDVSRGAVKPVLTRLTQRIGGLLAAHRLLSDTQWAPVRIDKLAEKVVGAAISADPEHRQARIAIASGAIEVSPRQASSLALVLNELTTNSVKYAHISGSLLALGVEVSADAESLTVCYHDNGPGFPPEVLAGTRSNVGLHLIRLLVTETLRGQLVLSNDSGAVVTMCIRIEEPHRT